MEEQVATNPWKSIFAVRNSKNDRSLRRSQIRTAVSQLQKMLGKAPQPDVADAWAMMLERFPGEQLAAAFDKVAMTSKNWPTTGDICEAIFEDEFVIDLEFLLVGLRRHKPEWAEIPASREPSTKGETIDDVILGRVIPAIPAPAIPARLSAALRIFGGTEPASGLERLYLHPACGGAARGEGAFIEREFKVAWLQARKAELGGKL